MFDFAKYNTLSTSTMSWGADIWKISIFIVFSLPLWKLVYQKHCISKHLCCRCNYIFCHLYQCHSRALQYVVIFLRLLLCLHQANSFIVLFPKCRWYISSVLRQNENDFTNVGTKLQGSIMHTGLNVMLYVRNNIYCRNRMK